MGFSTKAHLLFGVTIEIPEGVEWGTLDSDDENGIKMIAYGSDGYSRYAVAVEDSITTADLDSLASEVTTDVDVAWPGMVRRFCEKHGLGCAAPTWRLAVKRF